MYKIFFLRIIAFLSVLVFASWLGMVFEQSSTYLSHEDEVYSRENKFFHKHDIHFSKRMAGRFFIQTEEEGELWYISPQSFERIYFPSNRAVGEYMKEQAKPIDLSLLESIPEPGQNSVSLERIPETYRGAFVLANGEAENAWYINPEDGYRYSVSNQERVLVILQELAQGILNEHLRKIPLTISLYENQ